MTKYRVYSQREFLNLLKRNGYEEKRKQHGSHRIFYRRSDSSTIIIPDSVNPMICRRLIKENGLKDD